MKRSDKSDNCGNQVFVKTNVVVFCSVHWLSQVTKVFR